MSTAPTTPRPGAPEAPPSGAGQAPRSDAGGPPPWSGASWGRPLGAGLALVLAGAPVGAVVQGGVWWAYAAGVVALVVLVGIAAHPLRPGGVAAAQLVVLAGAVTARFSTAGVLRVLPGPAAAGELAARVDEAGTQIRTGVAPVPATPAMLLLVTLAFGLTAIAVHAVAIGARAPAAAGVVLLAVFAVPTALADELLPAWMLAAAAAGFGLLLLAGTGRTWWRRAPAGLALTGLALVLALGVGAAASGIGTGGRITGDGGSAVRGGEIGLTPFAALRGQLQQRSPADLFRVTGLPRPVYLRALTLSGYVANTGWQPRRPGAGRPLAAGLPAVDVAGDRVAVEVENLGFRDYWLPLFGEPTAVTGIAADRWAYDSLSGTVFSTRPRREDSWTEQAVLPAPSAAALRAATGTGGVDPAFLDTGGIDPRVAAIAARVTSGASTAFDRAVALNSYFNGPDSTFRYDLSTAPGNGDDAMVDFLTRGRRGYCEQFASSMAAMLRTVGVPSRVAVGFTGGREDGDGRTVGTADAHAWVEAWFPGTGWTTFDPTPLADGRAIVPPYVAQASGPTPSTPETAPAPPQDTTTPTPEPTADPSAEPTAVAGAPDTADAADPAGSAALISILLRVLEVLAAAGAVAAIVAAPALVRARQRRARLTAAAAGGPRAADAAWAELLAESTDRGSPGTATDTVRGAARRMVDDHGLDARAQQAMRDVVGIVEASWYGDVDAEPGALTGPARAVRDAIATTPLGVRGRLLPRSLTDGLRRRRVARGRQDTGDGAPDGLAEPDRDHDDAAAPRR